MDVNVVIGVAALLLALLSVPGLVQLVRQKFGSTRVSLKRKFRVGLVDSLDDHFRGLPPDELDLILYPVSVKLGIPVTDLLYMEYLRSLLRNDGSSAHQRCRAVRMIVSHAPEISDDHFETYLSRVSSLFGPQFSKVEVLNVTKIAAASHGGLPPLFWKALETLQSEEYFKWVEEVAEVRATTLRQLSQSRPAADVVSGIVRHTADAAFAAGSIAEVVRALGDGKDRKFWLGVLVWEVEPDRLAVYHLLTAENGLIGADREGFKEGVELKPLTGRTILGRRGRAGDNHGAKSSIYLYDDVARQAEVAAAKPRSEINAYVRALVLILRENYGQTIVLSEWTKEGRRLLGARAHAPGNTSTFNPKTVSSSVAALVAGLAILRRKHGENSASRSPVGDV